MNNDSLRVTIKKIVEQSGYGYWGIEYSLGKRRALLRVFIDHPEGVSLDDCSSVSHQLGGVLDVEGIVGKPYTLEVSSPGIDRLLFDIEHYRRYVGSKVRISCHAAIDGRKKFVGSITKVTSGTVFLQTDAGDVGIPVDGIRQGHLISGQTATVLMRKTG